MNEKFDGGGPASKFLFTDEKTTNKIGNKQLCYLPDVTVRVLGENSSVETESFKSANKHTLGTLTRNQKTVEPVGANEDFERLNEKRSPFLTTAAFTAICLVIFVLSTLLCIYVRQNRPKIFPGGQETEKLLNSGIKVKRTIAISDKETGGSQVQNQFDMYEWQSLPELAKGKSSLHFQVLTQQNIQDSDTSRKNILKQENIQAFTAENTFVLSGRPEFCTKVTPNSPSGITFHDATSLHIKSMDSCSNYLRLILEKWRFPQINCLKLQMVDIQPAEFGALTTFIEHHNETLHKLEIDQSYMCPNPDCDAGMISLPNHHFQIVLTRRKETEIYDIYKKKEEV